MLTASLRYALVLGIALLLIPTAPRAQTVTLAPHHAFQVEAPPAALAFSSDGRLLLAGGEDGHIAGWNVTTTTAITQTRLPEEIRFLGFLAGDTSFVAVDDAGAVAIGQPGRADLDVRFRMDETPRAVALDASRRYLAVATDDEQIHLFDLQAGMAMGRVDARDQLDELRFLGFDRLGEQLVAITRQGTVLSWNPKTQRQIRSLALSGGEIHGSRSVIRAAAAHRGANVFVVGLQEVALPKGGLRGRARPGDLVRRNTIIAYDWDSGIEIKRITAPNGPVQHIALGPGSDHVVITQEDEASLSLVNLRAGELGSTTTVEGAPRALALSANDSLLAVGTDAGRVAVWSMDVQAPPSAQEQDDRLPTLSGRIRVLSETTPALTPDSSAQVAVLPFKGTGDTQKVAALCSDVLTTQLANVDHLTLLERERIDDVLDELDLQASNLTVSNGAEIGKLLNADYLIMGNLNALGTTYLFNARLLRVETSQIVDGRQVICEECRFQDVFDAIHLLGTTIAQ